MKKNWQTERKWEMNKVEIRFEKLLSENGFNVIGIKEFSSKTDYLIEKDGVECTYDIHHVDNKPSRGDLCFKTFVNYYNITAEYKKLKE
jgi:hypothetical protein